MIDQQPRESEATRRQLRPRTMRILFFYQYFGTNRGAYSTRVYEFCKRWVENGDSVSVITSAYDRSDLKPTRFLEQFKVDGIDVRMINIRLSNKHGFVVRLATFAAYALLSCWYALVLPADVVVTSSGPLTVGLPGLLFRYLRWKPFVFSVRDLWPEGAIQLGFLKNPLLVWTAKCLERVCYRSATRIIASSQGQADWITDHYGIRDVAVIPHGANNDLVASVEPKSDLPSWAVGQRLVVYAGALGLIDDCNQVLQVAKVFQQRKIDNVQFVVIGDGKERKELETKARDQQLDQVRFLGFLPKSEMFSWLLRADCALFLVKDVPFLATASPNKLYDAFAAGVPIVQATQGWIKDLFDREQCGLTVAANDPEAMADAVWSIIQDPALRERLAANSRRVANNDFDLAKLAAKKREILLSCLPENHRS